MVPTVPNEGSISKSKLSKENSVRLVEFKSKPLISTLFDQSVSQDPTGASSILGKSHFNFKPMDENNNHGNFTNKNIEEETTTEKDSIFKRKLQRFKAIRMMSSPSRSIETDEESYIKDLENVKTIKKNNNSNQLMRNFLIDNMTDYYNSFIKRDLKYEQGKKDYSNVDFDSEEDNFYDTDNDDIAYRKKMNRFDRLFKGRLKRSRSLEFDVGTKDIDIQPIPKGKKIKF